METQEMRTNQSTQADAEARVEALLARTLTPQPPPESLRRQVRKRVAEAWERRPLTVGQRMRAWLRVSMYQRAWATVVALAVVAVVAALVFPSGGVPVAGTVVGKTGTVVAALATVAVIAVVVAWFLHKHRH
ncbi:MAG: hypothetical protein WHX52_01090 [Anaerolineae bacterium]